MSTKPFQAEIWPVWRLFGTPVRPKLPSEMDPFYTVTIN